jgi:hypothetical protein
VTTSGDGNQQIINNEVDTSGLEPGSYSATVTVSSANATNSPVAYPVSLSVGPAAQATSVTLTTGRPVIVPFGIVPLTASVTDQYGVPFAAVVTWQVTGGGDVIATKPGVEGALHQATLTSDGTEGTFIVTASADGITAEAEVTVALRPPLHLRINCGDNSLDVSGWQRDDGYVSGGEDWTNDDAVSTAGVTDAAPAAAYRTVRHCATDTGSCPRFDFFDLFDGAYTVRLHFADRFVGPRHIDVTIEGKTVLADFDIASSAGGTNQAVVREFAVTVADGDGMTIQVSSTDGDAFVAAIEIVDGGDTTAPMVAITDPVDGDTVSGDLILRGTAADPQGVTAVQVQIDAGPRLAASGTDDWQLTIDTAALTAGTHVISARATDVYGNSTTTDVTVTVVAAAAPKIIILSPLGGEKWAAGTTKKIRWSAVGVDDVSIAVTTGAGYTVIASSVDRGHPEWSSYSWRVPDSPSSECQIKIEGYFREAQAITPVFSILATSSSDLDAIVGGCSCEGAGPRDALGLVLAAISVLAGRWLRRRSTRRL